VVAHVCNHSYLGGLWVKASLGKKLVWHHLNQQARHDGTRLSLQLPERRIMIKASSFKAAPWAKTQEPIWTITEEKKGLWV
jgi:hypothetical protein